MEGVGINLMDMAGKSDTQTYATYSPNLLGHNDSDKNRARLTQRCMQKCGAMLVVDSVVRASDNEGLKHTIDD
jgi:hypothetical protein